VGESRFRGKPYFNWRGLRGALQAAARAAAHEAAPRATLRRWSLRDFPALLAAGGVWLNSAAPQTTPALIRPPLRCSAAPKGGTGRSLMRLVATGERPDKTHGGGRHCFLVFERQAPNEIASPSKSAINNDFFDVST
jgi:hypothetical protein